MLLFYEITVDGEAVEVTPVREVIIIVFEVQKLHCCCWRRRRNVDDGKMAGRLKELQTVKYLKQKDSMRG